MARETQIWGRVQAGLSAHLEQMPPTKLTSRQQPMTAVLEIMRIVGRVLVD
jgi:hypothetical protein